MKAVSGKRLAKLAQDKGWKLSRIPLLPARNSLAPPFGGNVGGPGRIRPTVRMAHDRKLLAPK